MPRFTWLSVLIAMVLSHADAAETCTTAPTADESSLLQKLPAHIRRSNGIDSKRQPLPAFVAFMQQQGREYTAGSAEYEHRRSLFERRVQEVESFNARPSRLWTAGVNHLSDWTNEELSSLYGWKGTSGRRSGTRGASISGRGGAASLLQTTHESVLKDEISWAHLNASKVVRNQGGCGSCWAFASALMLEANHEIHQKKGRTFSAQELVDCVPNKHHCGGSGGCDGATVELAMDYAIKYGLDDETASPYVGYTRRCPKDLLPVGHIGTALTRTRNWLSHHIGDWLAHSPDSGTNFDVPVSALGLHAAGDTSKGMSSFGLIGWERLPENKYVPLMRAVVEHGPVAVSIAASEWSSYIHGIFDDCDKDAVINHAVTLIGYGKDDVLEEKFWLIQNSWGEAWGEEGHIRILRRDTDETQCGTDRQPQDGTGCEGGPVEVTVCGMCGILYDAVVPHFSRRVEQHSP